MGEGGKGGDKELTQEQLLKFCAGSNSRYQWMSKPWSEGHYTYATNGCIIVRIPRISEIDEDPSSASAVELFAKSRPCLWVDLLPELSEPEYKECSVCEGKGCDDCNGIGKYEVLAKTEIDGIFFNNSYLRLIKNLPGCKFGPVSGKKPAWFEFDGGDGFLMPMRC